MAAGNPTTTQRLRETPAIEAANKSVAWTVARHGSASSNKPFLLPFKKQGWHGPRLRTVAIPSAKRILYVHNSADIYGASRSLLRLLPRAKALGFEPMVVLPENGPLCDRIEQLRLGIKVLIEPGLSVIDRAAFKTLGGIARFVFGFPPSVARILRLIRRHRVALVHTNTGVMPSPALAAALARVPHVWHIRDSFLEFRSLWSVYRRYITGLSRRVICVSNPIAAQFPGARNIVVIHNGVPPDEFQNDSDDLRTSFRSQHHLGDGLVVGCVGRIKFGRKGQEVLVQAITRLKQRGLVVKCLIVGSTSAGNEDHQTRLQQLIRDLGMNYSPAAVENPAASADSRSKASEADVIFTGELADPRPAYAAMDVFVLPSAQPEPFGGVVLEAMAMNRPVIATAIGGSLDQVVDAETGFLVPPGDVDALAAKLELLIHDASLRERMGKSGRRRLEECFSIGGMVEKILTVYDDAMNSGIESQNRTDTHARGKARH